MFHILHICIAATNLMKTNYYSILPILMGFLFSVHAQLQVNHNNYKTYKYVIHRFSYNDNFILSDTEYNRWMESDLCVWILL